MKTQSKTLRFLALGLATLGAVPAARGQAPEITHDAVACIVAGKYPKLRACFSPPSQVAKARVYFRREDRPIWYHVEMTSDAPCFSGVLPRPTRELVGKRVPYYVEVANQRLDVGRTEEHSPQVVQSETECRVQAVAPYVAKAAVKVFPGMPPGFAGGGLGSGLIAGGAAVVGIGAGVIAGRGGSDAANAPTPGTGPSPAPPSPSPSPSPGPSPNPSPSPSPSTNGPPTAVFAVSPDPPAGTSPMAVRFNLCRSSDPDNDPLVFRFDFGDGEKARGSCREDHTYRAPATGEAAYRAVACVSDGRDANEQCRTYEVRVRALEPAGPGSSPLTVGLAGTGAGTVSGPGGLNCPGTCTANLTNGSTATLTAAPASGSTFEGWSVAACGRAPTCTLTIGGPQTVTATFDAIPVFPLTVILAGGGTGNVAGPGINCLPDCTESYPSGTVVTLTATASPGSTFRDWSTAGCGAARTCQVTMNGPQTVTVTFLPVTFTLNVSLAGSGSGLVTGPGGISCLPSCTGSFASGSVVTLNAQALGTSTFEGWSVASCGRNLTCTISMTASQSVTASFDQPVTGHRITVLLSGTGNVESDHQPGIVCPDACSYPAFPVGSTVTLTADRNVSWGGACSGSGRSCSLFMNQDYIVEANFPPGTPPRPPSVSAQSWLSDLRVPRGRGQVVLHQRAWVVGQGPQRSTLETPPGESRVEATLTQGAGAGTWRFELPVGIEPGTLRVVEGKVEALGANAVVFRLRGKPGERVVFTFRTP